MCSRNIILSECSLEIEISNNKNGIDSVFIETVLCLIVFFFGVFFYPSCQISMRTTVTDENHAVLCLSVVKFVEMVLRSCEVRSNEETGISICKLLSYL